MTPYEYYSNLIKYKKKDVNSKLYDNGSLSHAGVKSYANNLTNKINTMKNYGYYNKLDNFYGPGKARYFYTKDEWDAYQRQSNAFQKKAKDEVKYAKEIKENREKNSNVYEAQKAREHAEKQGQTKTQRLQSAEITLKGHNTDKLVNSLFDEIAAYGDNKTTEKLSKIRSKYGISGSKSYNDYVKDPEWQKLYNAHVKNYKSDDPEYDNAAYKMKNIQDNYQKERTAEIVEDIKDLIKNASNPDKLAYQIMRNYRVMRALSDDVKVYNELMSFIRTLPLDYNTATGVKGVKNKDVTTWDDVEETFDNSKNIKRWS